MQMLLNPAITLMNRLRYPQKFLLISILFIMPLALVIALLIAEVNARADFAEKERAGDAYLRSVRHLFDDALQERLDGEILDLGFHHAGVESGDVEQRVEQAIHGGDRTADLLDETAHLLVHRVALQGAREQSEGVNRLPQIVTSSRDKL